MQHWTLYRNKNKPVKTENKQLLYFFSTETNYQKQKVLHLLLSQQNLKSWCLNQVLQDESR